MSQAFPSRNPSHLPKWPFFLADASLVLTGILLAVLSDGPLTPLRMALVVLAVGWGGCLAVLPYVLEYSRKAGSTTVADTETADWMNRLYRLEFRLAELEDRDGAVARGDIRENFAKLREDRAAGDTETLTTDADKPWVPRPASRPNAKPETSPAKPAATRPKPDRQPVVSQEADPALPPELAAFLAGGQPDAASTKQPASVSAEINTASTKQPTASSAETASSALSAKADPATESDSSAKSAETDSTITSAETDAAASLAEIDSTEVVASTQQDVAETPLQQKLREQSSVHELLGVRRPEPSAEGDLPTSLDEIGPPASRPAGMIKRAMKHAAPVGNGSSIHKLIQGGNNKAPKDSA